MTMKVIPKDKNGIPDFVISKMQFVFWRSEHDFESIIFL